MVVRVERPTSILLYLVMIIYNTQLQTVVAQVQRQTHPLTSLNLQFVAHGTNLVPVQLKVVVQSVANYLLVLLEMAVACLHHGDGHLEIQC